MSSAKKRASNAIGHAVDVLESMIKSMVSARNHNRGGWALIVVPLFIISTAGRRPMSHM